LSTPGGYVDIGNDIAGSRYDAATANWGGRWKMPSSNQINALLNCTKMQAKLNGMKGVAFIGANGNKIFMPADISNIVSTAGIVGETLGIGKGAAEKPKAEKPAPEDPCCDEEEDDK
jgi:hypothetical protein